MTTVREIKIIKSLEHPNVVPIIDMVVHPSEYEHVKSCSGRLAEPR